MNRNALKTAVYLIVPRKWTLKTNSCPIIDFVVKLITLSIMDLFSFVLIMNLANCFWYKYLNVTMKRNSNGPTSKRTDYSGKFEDFQFASFLLQLFRDLFILKFLLSLIQGWTHLVKYKGKEKEVREWENWWGEGELE